ncbi:MAG: metallophosphoesterase family protein [Candidatus Hodarchaeales archaeon]|jgi:putative phosphoesterase
MTIVAIISDIHANLSALRAVLADIHHHYVTRIFCLGDLVGYYTEPVPVIHLTLARCEAVIKGNHDEVAALGEVPTHFRSDSQPTLELATHGLTVTERKLLHGLPFMYNLQFEHKKAMLIHGGPEFPLDQYLYPDDEEDLQSTFDFMELVDIDVLFLGHTHIPFEANRGKRIICNPGSVGQPRDGDKRASYVLFNTITLESEFMRVNYDPTQTIEGIKKYDLSIELADRLLVGR